MTKLYRYQRKGVRWLRHFNGRAVLADEMGLGKTLQSLTYAAEDSLWPLVIVCPAYLKWNWEREVKQHLGMRALVLEGRKAKMTRMRSKPQIVIINYDILETWLPYLRQLKPQLIIADEGHYLANPSAKRTRLTKQLVRSGKNRKVVILTGTPISNRPAELWSLLNIVRPDLYKRFLPFGQRYCGPKFTPWGIKYTGAKRLPELHRELTAHCMIRRLKRDVLDQLPPKQRYMVPMELPDRKEYEEAQTDLIQWLRKKSVDKARKAKKAQHLVKWNYLRELIVTQKIKLVKAWVDDFMLESDEKLIIVGHRREPLNQLHALYPNNSLLITGKVSGAKRMKVVDQLNNDKRKRLLFGNIAAVGVGLNLVGASALAVIEFPWTPGALAQVEARIDRIGQKRKTSIYYLAVINTIEERLCRLLQSKQAISDAAIDGIGKSVELDIFNELEKELMHDHKRHQTPQPRKANQRTNSDALH